MIRIQLLIVIFGVGLLVGMWLIDEHLKEIRDLLKRNK